jgi:hypothetical protein
MKRFFYFSNHFNKVNLFLAPLIFGYYAPKGAMQLAVLPELRLKSKKKLISVK